MPETVTFDKSGFPRKPVHYFAQWISIGWLFFYATFPITTIILYYVSPWFMFLVLGIVVVSALYPVSRKAQPKWGWALGQWCVRRASEYFHIKCVVEDLEAVKKSGPAIIAMEPHDVLPISIFSFHECLKSLPGHNCLGCVTSACFNIPIMRHMYTWFDVVSVDKTNIINALKRGQSPVLVPGGVAEVTYLPDAKRNKECVLYLSSRLGFVKLALKNKVPIIPVFCFGLQNTFTFWVPENKFVHKIGRMIGFLPMVFKGMWGLPFGPARPCDYTNVVGAPIPFEPCVGDEPTSEEIAAYHAKFITALKALFEKHKASYGMGNVALRIV